MMATHFHPIRSCPTCGDQFIPEHVQQTHCRLALSRSVDSLGRMARAGTITRDMEIAGLRFGTDFAAGSASDGTGRVDRAALARHRCNQAVDAVGRGSPAALMLIGVVGEGESIAEWSAKQVWGAQGRSLRPAIAAGILVQALWALNDFYAEGK